MRAHDAACANYVLASGAGFAGLPRCTTGLLGLSVTINPSRQTRESRGVSAQANANASKLEHSNTKPAAVSARNPSETKS
jgi:hypothetical protein